jgi:hypothetical protein
LSQNFLLVRLREASQGWETGDETLEIRNNGSDLSLLEHRLADEDVIRVTRSPPGKIARGSVVPSEQTPLKLELLAVHERGADCIHSQVGA